jgi:hypothetical protein
VLILAKSVRQAAFDWPPSHRLAKCQLQRHLALVSSISFDIQSLHSQYIRIRGSDVGLYVQGGLFCPQWPGF